MTDTEKMAQALRKMLAQAENFHATTGHDEGGCVQCDALCMLIPEARAALGAHESRAQPAAKTLALFTANQAQALLDAFGGSATTYALIECAEGECAPQEDGRPSAAGLYIFDTNCPEEGVIYLGDEDEDSEPRAQPASVAGKDQ